MATIEILVRNKIASQSRPRLPMVCGNNDYIIKFNFDAEWDAFENKIAVFAFKKDGKWENIPVLFDGTEVTAPILRGVTAVYVGCTAGDVRTTTPAAIACLASATDSAGTETPPPEDIWGQILDKLDSIGGAADGTLGITGATVGQVAAVAEVDADGKPQKWTATDMQSGGATVQADFAQNAADAADYIKNRPGGYDADGQPVQIPAKYIGIADWAKAPDKPAYTAAEVGAATPAMLIDVARQAKTLGVTGATVGQMPQISAVDDDGKPTAWAAVDAPQGGGMYWATVADFETIDKTSEIYVDKDTSGVPFENYNAVAMLVSFFTPADSTQASASGAVWTYPCSSMHNSARIIINIAGWKTIARTTQECWLGTQSGYVVTGLQNFGGAAVFDNKTDKMFDAVRLTINAEGDSFPAGTKVRILLLTGGANENIR